MAFDTVIDKAQLEDAITASADAIREKTGGTSPIVWDTDKGLSDAIRTIQTGGSAPLPELTNPADEESVVKNMEFIGADGTVETGTMPSLDFGGMSEANEDSGIVEEDDGRKELCLMGKTTNSQRSYVNPNSSIMVYMTDTDEKMSMFGDARPEDVVAGKIFTSKEGFAMVGTHACTGGGTANIDDLITDNLTEIISNVKTIDDYTFRGKARLGKAHFPMAETVGANAFYGCSRLVDWYFPNTKTVGANSFCRAGITNANGIVADFPSLTKIGAAAFKDGGVVAFVLRSNTVCVLDNSDAISNAAFDYEEGYIFVPSALLASYKVATNWSDFDFAFRPLEDYTVDGTLTGALDLTKI